MQPWTIEKREQQSINPVNESSPREEKDHQHFTFTYSYGDQLVPTPTLQRLISSATLSTAPTTFSTTFSIITGLPLQTDGAQQPISYPHDAEEQQQQPPRSNDSSSGTAPAVIASVSLVCILALILLAWYKRVCKKEYQWIGKQSWLSSQIERLDVRRGKTVQRSSMLWDQDAENVTLIDDSSVESD
jgi:hypothetical protein